MNTRNIRKRGNVKARQVSVSASSSIYNKDSDRYDVLAARESLSVVGTDVEFEPTRSDEGVGLDATRISESSTAAAKSVRCKPTPRTNFSINDILL